MRSTIKNCLFDQCTLTQKLLNACSLFALLLLWNSQTSLASDTYSIGLATWSGYPSSVQGFKDGLASHGLKEGKNIHFIQAKLSPDKQLQQQEALRFKGESLDLVYSLTTPGTSIYKSTLSDSIPIVFSIVTYPADSGLIESMEYSGNNLVGTSNYVPIRHYLKLLKLMLPTVKSVAIFHRKGEPNSKIQAANMHRILKREGVASVDRQATSIAELKSMANALVNNVDVFMTTTDTLMQSGGEDALIKISLANKIPILSSNKSGIKAGSTFGPVADFYTLGKISGDKAAKILLQKKSPTKLESELQDPPHFLANKNSIDKLELKLSKKALETVTWVSP